MSERVDQLLGQLTLEEKAGLTAGVDMWHAGGAPRLGFRGLKVSDGPNGARGAYWVGTTSACLPCGTALGSTWDVALVERLGHLLAEEARSKGADLLLAPTVNIHRSPLAGRNFECYSEDPFLSARLAVAYINGVQGGGVGATVKHFAANDSEFERHTISSEVDERTLREIYLPPFEAAITEARSLAVMAAYNRLNGTYCAEQPHLVDDILLGEWGFDGFIISDWWGVKSTLGTLRHGADLEMPGPAVFLGDKVLESIEAGEFTEELLDVKLRRLLGAMEQLDVLDQSEPHPDQSIDRPDHRLLLRQAAADSIVLLSNDGVLPLDPNTLTCVAVIGPNADVPIVQGGGSAAVTPHHTTTVLDGLRARLGDGVVVRHERGVDSYRNAPPLDPRWTGGDFRLDYFSNRELSGDPILTQRSASARLTWLGDPAPGVVGGNFSARFTAEFVAPESGIFTFALVVGGKGRLLLGGELVADSWDHHVPGSAFFGLGSKEIRHPVALAAGDRLEVVAEVASLDGVAAAALLVGCLPPLPDDGIAAAAAAAQDADVAIVVVGLNMDWETEGEDRTSMSLPGRQDELIAAVAAANPRTIVAVNAGSPVTMDWAEDVAAIAQLWYLGQESGGAVADVLVGDRNPSGKLPTTFPVRYEDNPTYSPDGDTSRYPGVDGVVRYEEGVFVGYRHYDREAIAPRFPFGHGLSYTTFDYGEPSLGRDSITADALAGGELVSISVDVTNSGDRTGSEIVQVYVNQVDSTVERPVQELKGFSKVSLAPGERATVSVSLDRRSFAYWDDVERSWQVEPGDFVIRVASSSRDLRGSARLTIR